MDGTDRNLSKRAYTHINYTDNDYRVFGPPGCGKTTYLARQVTNAVQKHGSHAVFLASFTRTAAAELAGRDLPIEKHQIGTLHAHCYRALSSPEIAELHIKEFNSENPGFELSDDSSGNLDEAATECSFSTSADLSFSEYQILRNKMIRRDLWPVQTLKFAERWENWKLETRRTDYTDLIEQGLEIVEYAPGKPSIGFFDECQDFTPLEISLVRKWGRKMQQILLCGDDDQCLYSFKGATSEAFLNPPIPDSQKRILEQSYRVPRKVQEYAQNWIEKVVVREPKAYKPRDEEGEIRMSKANWKNPRPAINDALDQMAKGKRVMFLTSCSYMLYPLIQMLRAEAVPYCNPYRATRGDWNPLATRGTTSAERILSYLRPDPNSFGDQARMWTYDEIAKWAEILRSDGLIQRGKKKVLPELKEQMAEANMQDLVEIFDDEGLGQALEFDLDWYYSQALASKQKGLEFPMKIIKKHGIHTLHEQPKCIVGTIHSVKGGEADVVYIFPDISAAGMREWVKPTERDNIIRQFYVGMTRAKETLVLCSPATSWAVRLPPPDK